MNREELTQALQKIAGDDIAPASIHLWPKVKQSLVAKKLFRSEQGDDVMKKKLNLLPSFMVWPWIPGRRLKIFP